MKCSNCSNDAIYVYEGAGIRDTPYCLTCLPSFARPMAKANVLKTTESYQSTKEQVLSRLAPSTSEDPEAVPAEETSPAPARRRSRTKSAAHSAIEEQVEEQVED